MSQSLGGPPALTKRHFVGSSPCILIPQRQQLNGIARVLNTVALTSADPHTPPTAHSSGVVRSLFRHRERAESRGTCRVEICAPEHHGSGRAPAPRPGVDNQSHCRRSKSRNAIEMPSKCRRNAGQVLTTLKLVMRRGACMFACTYRRTEPK